MSSVVKTSWTCAQSAWSAWNHFWFEFNHPLGLALVRIQLALVMIYLYVFRHVSNLGAYTDEGMVPRALALPMLPEIIRPPFPWFFWPDSMTAGVHGVFLGLLLCLLLGIGTRAVGIAAWILHMGFLQRNYSILFGADLIVGLILFYLAFTRCDDRLNLYDWLRGRPKKNLSPEAVSSAFSRLLQIQLCVIYAYTGWEKLKGNTWWDGTALWTVLGNPQMVVTELPLVRQLPLLISVMTFASVIFETYFPFAMLIPRLKKYWLVTGVLFHSGIGALMALWTFSLAMLAPYWLFLPPADLERFFASIRDKAHRRFPQRRFFR